MKKSSNPQATDNVNQKRGPQTGNHGSPKKHAAFTAEKSSRNSERSVLAQMVTDALELRGRDKRSSRNPAVEPLHPNTNVGRGPTRGNAGR